VSFAVRTEAPGDRAAVRRVVEAAFGRAEEADLVDALREDESWQLSLVAEVAGEVVGHLLFTRASRGLTALAPLSVLPAHQRAGVGAALMREGLARIEGPIVLLGHPEYYARFGFRPAAPLGLANEWNVDGPAWMIRGEAPPGLVVFPAPFGP
jgi:putative acetyltransferase